MGVSFSTADAEVAIVKENLRMVGSDVESVIKTFWEYAFPPLLSYDQLNSFLSLSLDPKAAESEKVARLLEPIWQTFQRGKM